LCAAFPSHLSVQAVAEQIAQERDAAEREAREKETRVLSQTREIDEMNDKVEELERGRRQLQAELDELVNSQGTADKNVSVRFEALCVPSSVQGFYSGEARCCLPCESKASVTAEIHCGTGTGFAPKSPSSFSLPLPVMPLEVGDNSDTIARDPVSA
jgi:uncharacterized coiled-coil protein SlyX